MKTIKRTIALLNVFLFCLPFSFSQWTSVSTGSSGDWESIYFFDSMNGLATSLNNIIHTTDGGNSWTHITGFGKRDIDFANTTIGFGVGEAPSIQKTTDGGNTWNSALPPDANWLWGVSVVNATTVFVSGTQGAVWKTTNGTNFTASNLPVSSGTAIDLDFLSTTTGCVLYEPGDIYRTTNAGTSWTLAYDGSGFLFRSIYFVDANNGYAVGTSGRVFKSTNAGVSWAQQVSGTTRALNAVHFYDVNNGIICGDSGLVLKTINGGATWIPDASTGTTHHLHSCYMFTPNSVIAGGDYNTMIKNANFVGIEDVFEELANIRVFPNPSLGIVNITSEKEIHSIRIFNPLGELVYSTVSPAYTIMMEIPDRIAGIYMIEFEIDGKKYAKKLICN